MLYEVITEHNSVIALTGADLAPSLDGIGIPLWTSLKVKAGSRISFGTRRIGARCYLAIAGGIDVPIILGSRSTHIASQTGGMKGRTLAQGDILVSGTSVITSYSIHYTKLYESFADGGMMFR